MKIFENNHYVAVNKPRGIETSELARKLDLLPCHRLDKNTMGLLFFAKSKDAEKQWILETKEAKIVKTYQTLVFGQPTFESQLLKAYLSKDSERSKVRTSIRPLPRSTQIDTYVRFLDQVTPDIALLEIQIKSGQTHQIRAELARIGLPIVGCDVYGDFTLNKKFGKKGQLLYATTINFMGNLKYLNKERINARPNWKSEIREIL